MAAIEEPIAATGEQEVASAPAAEETPKEENTAAEEVAGKPRKAKEVKPKKAVTASKPRKTPTHPPYFEMMSEAITTLKERNGSSQKAIQKFIEEKHKDLPPTFRKLLLVNLRKFVASGRLVKVKGSFKLPSGRPAAPKPETAPAKKKKAVVKAKTAAPKAKTAAAKPKAAAAKPKAKAKAVAAKPKATEAKSKTVAKPKAKAAKAKPAAKPKAVAAAAPAKPKAAGTKRKAVAAVKPKEKPAKVAKTAAKSTPAKKAAPAAKKAAPKKAAPAAKKAAAVKSVKPKSVKSPVKRLKLLHLKKMSNIRSLDQNFCGVISTSTGCFHSLESLVLHDMTELQEWNGLEDNIMPSLRELKIVNCPKLKSLPFFLYQFTSLVDLQIEECISLSSIPKLPSSLESLTIGNCNLLKNKCQDGGEHWSNIKEIRDVFVDGVKMPTTPAEHISSRNAENHNTSLQGFQYVIQGVVSAFGRLF